MNDPLEPLDPEITELLGRAGPYPDPPDHVKGRVRDLVVHSILGGVAPGVGLGASHSVPAAPRHLSALLAKPVAWVTAGFVAGGVTGFSARGALDARPTPRSIPAAVSAAPAAPPAAAPPSTAWESLPMPGPASNPATRPVPPPPSVQAAPDGTRRGGASDLSAEQALLDTARAALVRGQGADALAPLERHAQRFPRGVLSEEREALEVNALVASGRYAEARQRGEQFFARHPGSLLRPSVEAALEAIP
jgi:hypothetical protein